MLQARSDEDPWWLQEHHRLTGQEARLVRRLARGASDKELSTLEGLTEEAARSAMRRLREKTGLPGRRLVAWAGGHKECCGSPSDGAKQVSRASPPAPQPRNRSRGHTGHQRTLPAQPAASGEIDGWH